MSRSAPKSPPPMTLPARAEASAGPPGAEKKERAKDWATISAQALLAE